MPDIFPSAILYSLFDQRYGTPADYSAELANIAALQQGQTAGVLAYTTKALLDANLVPIANTPAIVTNDSNPANNTYFIKVGGTGTGSWQKSDWVPSLYLPVSGYASLTAAVAAIGSTVATLVINAPTTCTANTTIPATLAITVLNTGNIDPGAFSLTGLKEAQPEWFGGLPDGVTDCSASTTKAYAASNNVHFSKGTWLLANVAIPDGANTSTDGEQTIFKKAANGYIFSMGRRTKILGGPQFDGDASGGKTGTSVNIDIGENTATVANQGHQVIENATFDDSESYHVAYNVANKGWMSRLINCKFVKIPTNAPASVLWPDELTAGGNRTILGGYSAGPVVNVNGCDNGYIGGGITVGNAGDASGVYFPPSPTNPAKKVIICGNRLAITGELTLYGIDHIVSDNEIAGGVTIGAGASNVTISNSNKINLGVTDNSGEINQVFHSEWENSTVTFKSGVTVGNGIFEGEHRREGEYINFRFSFTFGSTTAVTGTIKFNIPVAKISGTTRVFLGNALGDLLPGMAYIDMATSDIIILTPTTTAGVWNVTVPKAWATGDEIHITGRYRL